MNLARVALIALLLALAVRPAAALDDFGITPDKRLARALSDLADPCYECGMKAREKGLYTNARSFFDHALRYDADHAKTRRAMGFKKKGRQWVLEEDLIPLSDIVAEAKRAEVEDKLILETRPIRAKAADNLFKFVSDTKLPRESRLLALFHTLRMSPEHREAQKVVRANPGPRNFVHHLESEADARRQAWIDAAPAPQAMEGESGYEKALGFAIAKRRTPWVVMHCDLGEISEAWAETLARYTEAARSHALELTGMASPTAPTEDAQRLHFTVFQQRERFGAFVEKCSGIPDANHRAEVAKVSGGSPVYNPYGSVWLYSNTANDWGLRDGLAHDVAYKEVIRCTGEGGYWLARGLGYLNSVHMNASVQAKFFGVRATGVIDTGGKESMPGLGECAAGWRLRVALEIAGNRVIKPTDLARLRIADYTEVHAAFAFCLAEYLSTEHRGKLKSFLEETYKERALRHRDKRTPETATEILSRMYVTLEMDETALMTAYQAWAAENYVQLPE